VFENLRTHVIWCPSEGRGKICRPHQNTRNAKIPNLYPVVLEKYVPEMKNASLFLECKQEELFYSDLSSYVGNYKKKQAKYSENGSIFPFDL